MVNNNNPHIAVNTFAKEVHQNVVNHGWWKENGTSECERNFGELITMREKLSRAKRKDNGEWIEGYYAYLDSQLGVDTYHYILTGKLGPAAHYPTFECYLIDPGTVGDYICLADKNNKRIFEGDIVERGGRKWLVYYDTSYAQFRIETYTENGVSWSRDFALIPAEECEIVGNIHDNPELIKKVKKNG